MPTVRAKDVVSLDGPLGGGRLAGEWRPPVYEAGSSGFGQRLGEHVAAFLSGAYSVLDAKELVEGRQKLVWQAESGASACGKSLSRFLEQMPVLAPKIRELLSLFRCHLAPLKGDKQLRDRLEGELGRYSMSNEDPTIRTMLGVGGRFPGVIPGEERIRCRLTTETPIEGFPSELVI